ncbi:BrnA antitoxin family protein [Verminephrobacter aporrectodeae]|uniref:BrnA antitoxin family protein n=1 Tax=Verminephrobacter aporrectodeae TaxID=1110389 RepID=UPI0002378226|nr:BrnA antitoxin family protein [Verminephrobacter aporrectodeae]
MPKLKVGHVSPTSEEETAIAAGIAADADARELDDAWFPRARPAAEVLPSEVYAALALRPRGRPKAEETKVFTAIRLDADLLDAFKATGKGWQTRMNAALRQFIVEHPLDR